MPSLKTSSFSGARASFQRNKPRDANHHLNILVRCDKWRLFMKLNSFAVRTALALVALFVLALVALFVASAQGQQKSPAPVQSISSNFDSINQRILEMAQDFPADKYDFKPTKEVRSFGEALVHVISGN